MEKISMKVYLKLVREHYLLLCKYLKLKSKYEKIIKASDDEWTEVI